MNDLQTKMYRSMRSALLKCGLTWEKLRSMEPAAVEGAYWQLMKASGAPIEIDAEKEEVVFHVDPKRKARSGRNR